jgi:hypothetical protein
MLYASGFAHVGGVSDPSFAGERRRSSSLASEGRVRRPILRKSAVRPRLARSPRFPASPPRGIKLSGPARTCRKCRHDRESLRFGDKVAMQPAGNAGRIFTTRSCKMATLVFHGPAGQAGRREQEASRDRSASLPAGRRFRGVHPRGADRSATCSPSEGEGSHDASLPGPRHSRPLHRVDRSWLRARLQCSTRYSRWRHSCHHQRTHHANRRLLRMRGRGGPRDRRLLRMQGAAAHLPAVRLRHGGQSRHHRLQHLCARP